MDREIKKAFNEMCKVENFMLRFRIIRIRRFYPKEALANLKDEAQKRGISV
jgi:hypothetical protein